MPFDRKSSKNARHLFVGRANELQFFIENILKPEEPSHNILSISGQGGVGKTYLLNRFKEEAQAPSFKDHYALCEWFRRQAQLTGEPIFLKGY